jgi:hypothetical protein
VQAGRERVKANLDNKSNLDFMFILPLCQFRSLLVTRNFEGEGVARPAADFLFALPGTEAALYPLARHV